MLVNRQPPYTIARQAPPEPRLNRRGTAEGWPQLRSRRRLPAGGESMKGKRMAGTAEFWTGRRTAIGAALATLGGAPPAVGRDAGLVRLSARLVAIEGVVNRFEGDIGPDSPPAMLALLDEHDAALRAMLRTPARGLEGFEAKARAALAMLPPARPEDRDSTDPRALLRSLAEDVLGKEPPRLA